MEVGSVGVGVNPLELSPFEVAGLAIQGFGAMQKPSEFAALLHLVAESRPSRILEIGFGNGGTAWAWSKVPGVRRLILVNLPNGPWGGGNDENAVQYVANNCRCKIDYIAGNSQNAECLEAVESRLEKERKEGHPGTLDFLFIDGDHSAAGVAADYDLYKGLVRLGGLIAFHDIREHPEETGCKVKVFWDSLKAKLATEGKKFGEDVVEFIEEDDAPWGGIGVVRV